MDVAQREALHDILKHDCEGVFVRWCGKFIVLILRDTLGRLLKSACDYLDLSGSQGRHKAHGSQMSNPYHLRNTAAPLTLLPFILYHLQVQEVPQDEFQDLDLFAGPILRILDSPKAEFLKPVTIQLPVSLREKEMTIPDPSMRRVRIFFLRSETESKEWIEISSNLENPATYDGKVVKFEVRSFSGYVENVMKSS